MTNQDNRLYAIDVALVFKDDDIQPLIAANQTLFRSYPDGFLFDPRHRPHVTLLQAFLDAARLPDFHNKVGQLIKDLQLKTQDFCLEFTDFYYSNPFQDDVFVAGVDVTDPSGRLEIIHSQLVDLAKSCHRKEQGEASHFVRQQAQSASVNWVKNYIDDKSKAHFHPHLTLGLGSKEVMTEVKKSLTLPFEAKAHSVVNAHLGDFCTVSDHIFSEWIINQ